MRRSRTEAKSTEDFELTEDQTPLGVTRWERQEATRQVSKIERTTNAIAGKVVVPRREHRQLEYEGCSYGLVEGTKWDS